ENAFLVVVEIAIGDHEIAAFVSYARAVSIGHRRSGKFEVINGHIVAGDENRLLVRDWDSAVEDKVRHPPDANDADRRVDYGKVVEIGAGLHIDRVAVMRRGNGCLQGCKLLSGAYR